MLGVDERCRAALPLDFRDDLQCQRSLTGRFRPVYLDYPSFRQAADTERDVEPQRPGRDDLDVARRDRIAETHHRSLSKLFLDLTQGGGECFLAIVVHRVSVVWWGKYKESE